MDHVVFVPAIYKYNEDINFWTSNLHCLTYGIMLSLFGDVDWFISAREQFKCVPVFSSSGAELNWIGSKFYSK